MNPRDGRFGKEFQDGCGSDLPRYEVPRIRVYTEEEIAAQLGPAQLYVGAGGPFMF